MKNIAFFLAALLLITSCKKDELRSNDLLVYMPGEFGTYTNSITVPFVHTPVSVSGNRIVKVSPRTTREAVADIAVTIAVDTSLVRAYNTNNKKNLLVLPAGSYAIANTGALTIKAGSVSTDSLQVEITKPELLTNPEGYLLPLKITAVSGADRGVLISSNQSAAFINVTYAFNNISDDQAAAGLLLARTGWAVTVSNTTAGALGPAMLDGSNTTAWRSSNSSTAAKWVIVDLGAARTIRGFRLTPNYVAVAENATTILVSSSTDNLLFASQGSWRGTGPAASSTATAPDLKNINFITPVTARYFRLDISSQVSGNRVGIAELNVVQ
jgi:hypothetical protein